ncbi:MAG: ATP synthase F1 subunit gamma [Bacteroidia bacterium]
MANLKEIRLRIGSVKNTQTVTKAMKMVSAAKLRRAQDRILQLRPYAKKLREIIDNVTAAVDVSDIPSNLVKSREVKNVLFILVTSSRGLCGGFNSNLIKELNNFIGENYASERDSGNLHFLCLGKKGHDHFRKRGYNVLGTAEQYDVFANISFEQVNDIVNEVFTSFEDGTYDKVHLVFNEFKNVMAQNRLVDDFLPVAVDKDEEEEAEATADYIFEPGREEILTDLIPKALRTQVYRAVLESNASEQGSRMVAMDKATENANELLKDLKLKYNKARQAAITKEILEIAAGADALES